ncbi:hypothetical protein BJV82DRAFT_595016 [Fennellomyces sp. T-0311]|nr:hypothetical protein BJV82DRAFT_595016 [Fennellomyces sp. T-0311]
MSDSLLLLDAILREIAVSKQLTDENTHLLYVLFQERLYEALYLIEQETVKRVQCKAGRVLFRVSDTSQLQESASENKRQPYTCLVYPRYCSCPEFFNSTICDQQTLMVTSRPLIGPQKIKRLTWIQCRHALAAVLGDCLDRIPTSAVVGDEEFGEMMYRWEVEE